MAVNDPVDPIESGSAGSDAWAPLCVPGPKHPAEIVLRALATGRAVRLPNGIVYRLGHSAGAGCAAADALTIGEFTQLCAGLSDDRLFAIAGDSLADLAVSRRRQRIELCRRALARMEGCVVPHLQSLSAVLIQAVEASGHRLAGPTDSRAAEHGEPAWVCTARLALADAHSAMEEAVNRLALHAGQRGVETLREMCEAVVRITMSHDSDDPVRAAHYVIDFVMNEDDGEHDDPERHRAAFAEALQAAVEEHPSLIALRYDMVRFHVRSRMVLHVEPGRTADGDAS